MEGESNVERERERQRKKDRETEGERARKGGTERKSERDAASATI
jgi:hypothetical protein